MINLVYAPIFVRLLKKLEAALREEVIEKLKLLKNPANHKILKVHKLHGQMEDRWSFSVNYKTRVVFRYISKNEIAILSVGDHKIYE